MFNGRGAADGRRRCGRHGDSDLNGREKALRVFLKSCDKAGVWVPFLGQLLHTTAPGIDDRQLGAGEEAVQQDEASNSKQFQPHSDYGNTVPSLRQGKDLSGSTMQRYN